MKVSNRTKNMRRNFAWKKPFKCPYCDDLRPHPHTLEEIMKFNRRRKIKAA